MESYKDYAGIAEVKLAGASPEAQPLLAAAMAAGTRISKFEVMEPTLEEIFIETVGPDGMEAVERTAGA